MIVLPLLTPAAAEWAGIWHLVLRRAKSLLNRGTRTPAASYSPVMYARIEAFAHRAEPPYAPREPLVEVSDAPRAARWPRLELLDVLRLVAGTAETFGDTAGAEAVRTATMYAARNDMLGAAAALSDEMVAGVVRGDPSACAAPSDRPSLVEGIPAERRPRDCQVIASSYGSQHARDPAISKCWPGL